MFFHQKMTTFPYNYLVNYKEVVYYLPTVTNLEEIMTRKLKELSLVEVAPRSGQHHLTTGFTTHAELCKSLEKFASEGVKDFVLIRTISVEDVLSTEIFHVNPRNPHNLEAIIRNLARCEDWIDYY
jgi:hypothetical protein